MLILAAIASLIALLAWLTHFASYQWIKRRTLVERRWDYNICCGTTDGGGLNADILRHGDVPNFEQITDVTRLPHADQKFDHILCSHTIEHVDDPAAMFKELRRIGRRVTLLVPPLWDFTAALNPFEHQVVFLTLKSRHDNHLPPYVRFAFARWLQARIGQRCEADARAAHGGSAWRSAADYLAPVLFLGGAATAPASPTLSLALFAAGLGAIIVSKMRIPVKSAPTKTVLAVKRPADNSAPA
jgi:SAM-dependent methyltransferase